MRNANLVHITPRDAPEYWIVCVVGRGNLCRRFTDAGEAIGYQRALRDRHPWIR